MFDAKALLSRDGVCIKFRDDTEREVIRSALDVSRGKYLGEMTDGPRSVSLRILSRTVRSRYTSRIVPPHPADMYPFR